MTTVSKSPRKKRKAKWDRAVSRKFYESLCFQIHNLSHLHTAIDADKLMASIDTFIDTRKAPTGLNEIETVVYTLLRPNILNAILRSALARQSALRRRIARQNQQSAPANEPHDTEPQPTSPQTAQTSDIKPPRPVNTPSQRRIYKQFKRLSKRHHTGNLGARPLQLMLT